jgi:hypothetical protein
MAEDVQYVYVGGNAPWSQNRSRRTPHRSGRSQPSRRFGGALSEGGKEGKERGEREREREEEGGRGGEEGY